MIGLSNPPKIKVILGNFLVKVVEGFMKLFELNGPDGEGQEDEEKYGDAKSRFAPDGI